jgi:dCMP deaminase
MRTRITRESLYIKIAELFSQRSTCGRLKVGCAIIKDGRIICTGYNGSLKDSRMGDICNCNLEKPCEKAIHAEANAISFAAQHGIPLKRSIMYVTHSPCIKCAEIIIQSGIIEVVYKELFRDNSGLLLLKANNITVSEYESPV